MAGWTVHPEVQSAVLREVKASRPSRCGLEPGGEGLWHQRQSRKGYPGGFLEEADSEPRWDALRSPKGIACQVGPGMSSGASSAQQPGLRNGVGVGLAGRAWPPTSALGDQASPPFILQPELSGALCVEGTSGFLDPGHQKRPERPTLPLHSQPGRRRAVAERREVQAAGPREGLSLQAGTAGQNRVLERL